MTNIKDIIVLFLFLFLGGYCKRMPARTKGKDIGKHIAHFSFLLPSQRMDTGNYDFMLEVEKFRTRNGKFWLIIDL